jgi:[protein-PII] uridylyltransferase
VPTLLDKIEADAAKRLLPLPGSPEVSPLARHEEFLRRESHRIKLHHGAGGGGLEVVRARARVLDLLLDHLVEQVLTAIQAEGKIARGRFALVAIGGYGRGELNPHSDIDLMFLHTVELAGIGRGKADPFLTTLANGVLYPLWDLRLKVGHAVRTVEDCVKICSQDMQSKTSLIEARLVVGDEPLFQRMQSVVLAKCVRGCEAAYIRARLADQAARRAKFGGSATLQEPNIKNGCGGLRDYQNLLWMAYFKYRTRSLRELETRELISEDERRKLEDAYDFLLRVRTDLHYEENRPADVLRKNLQPTVAQNLGYAERSPVRRLELFMRDLYTHMRNIDLITRTLEQRLALLPDPQRRLPSFRSLLRRGRHRMQQQLVDGFKFVDGEIYPLSGRVFRDQPRRLLRVFFYAQQRGLKLHPDLTQMIRNELALVNREFLQDPHVHQTFLEILNRRGNVASILRTMHEVGLLGKYLPEFGRLTCLVQHEFFHQYTADEHTLVCLEQLDRVWEAKEPPHSGYTEIFQSLERPLVLYLALLLHDAGKAERTGQHSEVGGQIAVEVARRLGLDGATTDSLRLLIEHHLLLVLVSQRRDLDDPAVIRTVAEQVQTIEQLKMLTLHTLADSLGTSDQLWNGFKDSLLTRLYRRTHEHLAGETVVQRAEERQRDLMAAEVRPLAPSRISDEELQAHLLHLPPRYCVVHAAAEIATDLTLAHTFMSRQVDEAEEALAPVVHWHNDPDRGSTAVKICTWDRPGLFSHITGAFTAAGLNILSAQAFTRTDGIILDTFSATDAQTGLLIHKEAREKFEKVLTAALNGRADWDALITPRKVFAPLYTSLEGERIPTSIRFDNDTSETRTVIDVETEDHVGLLHAISRAFAELALDIALAKISTERGAAIDSFYVSETSGCKIIAPERQRQIEQSLRDTIARLEQRKPA